VQAGIGNRPVDFVAFGCRARRSCRLRTWWMARTAMELDLRVGDEPGADFARKGTGGLELRYLPVSSLKQERSGSYISPWSRFGRDYRYASSRIRPQRDW